MDLWLRPWAFFTPARRVEGAAGRVELGPGDVTLTLVRHSRVQPPGLGRPSDPAEPFLDLPTQSGETVRLALLPFPLSPRRGLELREGARSLTLCWPGQPDRPRERGAAEAAEPGAPLMQRARAVWDRIQDVEEALADPATLWQTLHRRWTGADPDLPQMHVIVRQARALAPVLDALERRPRRLLRRVHRSLPVDRVQEVDRRAMLWLARQPGEGLAEKAGEAQRLLAVAREESIDTLENRVLRSYAELAARVGRDYLARQGARARGGRAAEVERFVRRCRRLGRELAARAVRPADADATPNFVLQQNRQYRAVWDGWEELRRQDRIEDDLWLWQARSWEEYCALVLMVALIAVPGAKVVATAPLCFRDEQRRGSWIEADSPLGVVFLPDRALVAEVATARAGGPMARLGARIVLRLHRIGAEDAGPALLPVWPLWAAEGGLDPVDLEELSATLPHLPARDRPRGGIVLRPAARAERPEFARRGPFAALALGTDGPALRETLGNLTRCLDEIFAVGAP